MASQKRSQTSVRPNYSSTRQAGRLGRPTRILAIVAVATGAVAFAFTSPGVALMSSIFAFLAFYAGVFSLVALSLTVMGGLAATDRVVLMVRHRVLLQAVHRSMATAAMVFLAIHILTKIAQGHSTVLDVFVPFLANHRVVYIGLGTIASYLMIAITVTGVMRARFAGSAHPWLWRTMHATAYVCWPIALLHGVNAGRPAKTWVIVSYVLCLILVGLGLLLRLWVIWSKQLSEPRTRTAAVHRPVATAVSTGPAGPLRPGTKATTSYRSAHAPSTKAPPKTSHKHVPTGTPVHAEGPPMPKPVGRWTNANSETITDEEFWAYLRAELQQ